MCYSAQVHAEWKKFQRTTGAVMDLDTYVRTFWWDQGRDPLRKQLAKAPRAMIRELQEIGPPELRENLAEQDAAAIAALEEELFALRRRVGDAQRALQTKVTKKAQEDVRIGTSKGRAARRRLDALKRTDMLPEDNRVYPGVYCPVMVWENGQRVVKPMRYQCRPVGKPASYDRQYPGTYNARRDNLEGFWRGQFGHTHGIMIADRFYEHVEVDGENQILEFEPRTGEPMLVACLWSHWTDPRGVEPDLLSFAAITDDPEPEVAAAGHDRTIINLKPEHVDVWLNPDPTDLTALYRIFDDKRHPYYEHRVAA
ncbi:SOS response-associated peptidase family protein [Xanthomonas sp. XNM01]|uniref:SOS response-associated peptidase family protein n=1 Tax=Xanthomonas sp. XNM01 TaxID=2769289 RepID=UPI00177FFEED|nr:SOS response-associated peptidase family protein [Xanthomonas sp. XNM01]MBD9368869.1 SOS response-associated peptidase family protein [Xanthomonas sp. XNM01]